MSQLISAMEMENEILPKMKKVIFPEPASIYFLCKNKEALYIGQAICLPQRIRDHIKENRIPFDEVYAIECEKHRLNELEQACIQYIRPSFNRVSFRNKPRENARKLIVKALETKK